MRSLKKAGVPFEHYDLPGLRREGDVHVSESSRPLGPDGNILHINNQ